MDTAHALLRVLQYYAPDGEAQQRCADYLKRMQSNDATQKEIDLGLAAALVDGLRYGNWIWVWE
jgi:hypothetical protein